MYLPDRKDFEQATDRAIALGAGLLPEAFLKLRRFVEYVHVLLTDEGMSAADVFQMLSEELEDAGFRGDDHGWRRFILEDGTES